VAAKAQEQQAFDNWGDRQIFTKAFCVGQCPSARPEAEVGTPANIAYAKF